MNERPYWNMKIEPLLNTPDIIPIQQKNMQQTLEDLYHNAPYWRKRFDELKVKPEQIKTTDDLASAFPPLTKDDVRAAMMEFMGEAGPRGAVEGFMPASISDLVLMCTTSGTTGEPTPYFFTQRDLELWYESISRAFWRAGLRPGMVVIHAMALSMFAAGVPGVQALEHFGALAIPMGAEAGSERLLSFARLYSALIGIDGIVCTPSYAEYLIEKAPEVIGDSLTSIGIKVVFCGGEPGAGIPEVRKKIMEGFGAKVFDAMGMGPILWASCDHEEYQGMHFVTEDTCILELVDPETKECIPVEDGAEGAIVLTPLLSKGLSVIRHIVGDVARIETSPCPCGKTGKRVRIIGRVDDMLKVKGVMVYPAAIDGVIASFVPRVTGEFRIVLTEPPPRVTPPLKLKVEYGEGISEEELPALAKEIADKMHDRLRIRPEIQWVPPKTLERSVHKTRFIEKAYEKK